MNVYALRRLAGGFLFDGTSLCARLALQTSEQPRASPLRTVIADRDAQSLLLPDQHEQPLAPRDPCVDQIALEQHVVLRGERDHYKAGVITMRNGSTYHAAGNQIKRFGFH